jgi:ABC-2 type transport system ATP-binding protein
VLHGIGRAEANQRGDVLLERVGLRGAADRRVATYSGGMRRRLDLALSLVHEPTVLFLDEPTTGLDPTSRLALWEEVRRLNGEGTTVFLTTQYLEEADELAGRVAIIDGGRIVREGRPQALKETVGAHTLAVTVSPDQQDRAREILHRFGDARTSKDGSVAIGLRGGPAALPGALRALGDADVTVEHIELDAPSLDDVFAEATGRRLEGAEFEEPAREGSP